MSGIDTNSLNLMQSAFNYSGKLVNSFSSANDTVGGSKKGVYAQEGDPFYQKDMDKNEDGEVTFEEFKDYCLENDIPISQIKQMLKNRLNYQINNETNRASAEIKEIKSDSDAVYAEEGDAEYDEAVDEDKDGKITYEEYIKYCEEQDKETSSEETMPVIFEKTKTTLSKEEVVIKNHAKAVSKYSKSERGEAEGKVESEV